MKKVICLIILLFLLTGCDVEYNLKIDRNLFTEDVNIIIPNSGQWGKIVKNAVKTKQVAYTDDSSKSKYYYNLTKKSNDKNYILDYNYNYEDKTILFSNAINQCYKTITMNTANNVIDISTSPSFLCLYKDGVPIIENVKINIITDLKVISNNADEINGNTYTWKVDLENYENKPIKIKIDNQPIKESKIHILFIAVSILLLFVLVGFFIYYMVKKQYDKKNEF